MKYTQNSKILQVTNETMIVGVDIASEIHHARAFDHRGLEIGKLLKFSNDAEGFHQFAAWVRAVGERSCKNKVMVGMEPTGHYWFNLAQQLKDQGIKIVLVKPFHVKRSKELDDNNPTKNDRKDPKTIAMLVKDGRYMEPYIPEGIYSELRTAMETRWQIVKQLNTIRNRVKRWLSIYFPEFGQVFGDWEGKAALIVLREFPTPAKILAKGIEGIIGRWKQGKIRAVGRKRALGLLEAVVPGSNAISGQESGIQGTTSLLYNQKPESFEKETIFNPVKL